MTPQPPLPAPVTTGAVPLGMAASLVEDGAGARVFIHGQLVYVWEAGDAATRRFAAATLVEIKAATAAEIAAGFGVETVTVWRWRQALAATGVADLLPEAMGPKAPSRLSRDVISRIVELRGSGMSLQAVGDALGVSAFSVRRALKTVTTQETVTDQAPAAAPASAAAAPGREPVPEQQELPVLPVLPVVVPRSVERSAARAGLLTEAAPVFAPAAKVWHAGLFLAFPALETTGLLQCAKEV